MTIEQVVTGDTTRTVMHAPVMFFSEEELVKLDRSEGVHIKMYERVAIQGVFVKLGGKTGRGVVGRTTSTRGRGEDLHAASSRRWSWFSGAVDAYRMTEQFLAGKGGERERWNGGMPSRKYASISFENLAKVWGRKVAVRDFSHLAERDMFDERIWRPRVGWRAGRRSGEFHPRMKIKTIWKGEGVA